MQSHEEFQRNLREANREWDHPYQPKGPEEARALGFGLPPERTEDKPPKDGPAERL